MEIMYLCYLNTSLNVTWSWWHASLGDLNPCSSKRSPWAWSVGWFHCTLLRHYFGIVAYQHTYFISQISQPCTVCICFQCVLCMSLHTLLFKSVCLFNSHYKLNHPSLPVSIIQRKSLWGSVPVKWTDSQVLRWM